jgi:hypothetical protein
MKLVVVLSNDMVYLMVDGKAVWVGTMTEWSKAIVSPTKMSKVE